MSLANARNIAVKLYLTADDYLATKAKCDAAGLSMSTAGSIALRQWQPAHHIRRGGRGDMPNVGPKRALSLPGSRSGRGGAPRHHLRV